MSRTPPGPLFDPLQALQVKFSPVYSSVELFRSLALVDPPIVSASTQTLRKQPPTVARIWQGFCF